MKKILHRADERGVGEYGWLHARYSFSFASWYDPARLGFGALRVINDDIIDGGGGFAPHSHRDMEIVTIVTAGAVAHEDSLGNRYTVPAGDVQVMSAGTGVVHAEMNASRTEQLKPFQVWIEPRAKGLASGYAQQHCSLKATPGLQLLAAGDGSPGALPIGQDAWVSWLVLSTGEVCDYRLHGSRFGLYALVVEGEVAAASEVLRERDAIGIAEMEKVALIAQKASIVALFEVPLS
ncbi:pirin family protein [Candidatus Kaiserbacteria bacterium]|nr:pirin family protein [Candidatus Kaiserbacteria bacterium]